MDHIIPFAKFMGIVCPSLYCGFTASDSLTFIEPIVQHAPNQKVMAKQWFQGYQYGPLWVPPLIASSTISNLILAYTAAPITPLQHALYLAAALAIFSILPLTFFYMEPGINGALKWKVQSLCKDDGFCLLETSALVPSAHRHGSSRASRVWAERTHVRDLILFWRRVNNFRWVVAAFAAGLSGVATFSVIDV
ncbi:Hypothetical protein R9X50_00200700 [Acrodontium crateriforme]|uniref:Uncharacterized protein n=1 Tax=Acrodontium crateriforme TaxID=150365 RepID=A0AAQ3M1I3_9PEZI|nr:Hypothetical protein R9X50_00200700 [Acrodontium crateriforme]